MICALAPQAIPFTRPVVASPVTHKLASSGISFAKFLKLDGRILFVDGESVWARVFRARGFSAYQMDLKKRPPEKLPPYYVIGKLGNVPFRHMSFQAVCWMYTGLSAGHIAFKWASNVAPLVEPGGFLLFDEVMNPQWGGWLEAWGWQRLPFKFDYLNIWQKGSSPYFKHRPAGYQKLVPQPMAASA